MNRIYRTTWLLLLSTTLYAPIFCINLKYFPHIEIAYSSLSIAFYLFIFLTYKIIKIEKSNPYFVAWLIPYTVSTASYLLALALTDSFSNSSRTPLMNIVIITSFMPYLVIQVWIYSAFISISLLAFKHLKFNFKKANHS